MSEPRTEPRTESRTAAKLKPDAIGALKDADVMAVVHPILSRGLQLAIAEDNTADRGELMRPQHRMAQRYLAQSRACAGDPDPIAD